jgi:hypothetical protein
MISRVAADMTMSLSRKRNGKVDSKASVPVLCYKESLLRWANLALKHLKLARLTSTIATIATIAITSADAA